MKKINNIIRKNCNLENILCLFLVLCPILDIVSFLYRKNFNTNFSPSTIMRPIIPMIIITFLFFTKNKKFKLYTFLAFIIYAIYGIIHLYLFTKVKNGSSYSTVFHEAQYIINYSFMILNLFIYIYVFGNNKSDKLKKTVLFSTCIYIISIFISIITKTSSHTYIVEKLGYKGWFESGNSIGAILILSMFVYITYVRDAKYKKIAIPLVILVGIFLTTLIGTRVGLFGFILVLGLYIMVEVIYGIVHNKKVNKKIIAYGSIGIIGIIVTVVVFGSNTFERRKQLQEVSSEIVDTSLNKSSHITGDLLQIKNNIDNNNLEDNYMNNAQKQSIIDLYNVANKLNIRNSERRMQELIYNIALVKNQKDVNLLMFGNGYVANFRELILEMEIPAFLFNFGILGFILYFIPFVTICIYGIYIGIKNIRKINTEYIMLVLGCGATFGLSFFSGYTFLNSSSMMIIIAINTILISKINKLKEEK